ncbi:MAG: hypothetical protein JNG84_13900, partial [Archangium sp.]|nr:hypothetical protein [Archangium sp.]
MNSHAMVLLLGGVVSAGCFGTCPSMCVDTARIDIVDASGSPAKPTRVQLGSQVLRCDSQFNESVDLPDGGRATPVGFTCDASGFVLSNGTPASGTMTIDAYGVAGELRFTGPVSFTSRTVGEVCW